MGACSQLEGWERQFLMPAGTHGNWCRGLGRERWQCCWELGVSSLLPTSKAVRQGNMESRKQGSGSFAVSDLQRCPGRKRKCQQVRSAASHGNSCFPAKSSQNNAAPQCQRQIQGTLGKVWSWAQKELGHDWKPSAKSADRSEVVPHGAGDAAAPRHLRGRSCRSFHVYQKVSGV